MTITITTPASSTKLTSVKRFKAATSVKQDNSQDNELDRQIDVATSMIEKYCNKVFAKQTYTETLKQPPQENMFLKRFPIISITSIKFKGDLEPTANFTLQQGASGIVFKKTAWIDSGVIFDYEVIYVAGFILPSFTTGTVDLPPEIEDACIRIVQQLATTSQRDSSISEEEVPEVYKAKYVGANTPGGANNVLTREIRDLLDPYRIHRI